MAFFDEVLSDLLKTTSAAGSNDAERIESLRKDVEKLRRTVAVLAQMLYENDAFGRLTRDQIRERFAVALRMDWEGVPIPEGDTTKCGACGKMLFEDDPELTLQSKGRVCMSCFQRGG